ncbi:hypothetical protein ABZX74_15465 [Streptomyces olivaceoviridis]|uniref:hypothetical protein n=1 Tax=Streptomyces olivaceoviridis TaxID=1921 RepID=UPI0033A31560
MTDRIPLDHLTSDALDALYEQLEAAEATETQRQLAVAREALASATTRAARADAAIARVREVAHRWRQYGTTDLKRYADILVTALDQPAPAAATRATDGTVCGAYQPPATAEMTGLCARCGMYDYRHTAQRTRVDAVGVDPIDPINQYRRLKIELEHWQTVIVPELRAQRDRATAALGEILLAFSPVSSHNGVRIGWTVAHPVHPDDYDRWDAALPKGSSGA